MSEKTQITFMQVRLIRLATETWNLSLDRVAELFEKMDVFGYIESGYGIFHCEGDETILEEIAEFLARKGININEGVK